MNFFPHFFSLQSTPRLGEQITWWHAIILGLVQGLTEFIPVSSSAHLNITHWLFGQPRAQTFTFDMFLNVGTLAALAWYFRHDWKEMLFNPAQKRLRNLVIMACVPAAIAGVLLRGMEDKNPLFADVKFNAVMLTAMALLLWMADHVGRKRRDLDQANWKDSVVVGCSQALALIPGVSRSGATITAGLARRLKREDAARFSFLMSLPITLGAVFFEFYGTIRHGRMATLGASPGVLALGVLAAALSGFWAISFLLNYLRRHSVLLFVIWRILVTLLVFGLILARLKTA
jgi:undecaprenyl-diphosphatase